jgi:protein required for attachment to host cells
MWFTSQPRLNLVNPDDLEDLMKYWLLVADAAQAQVYSSKPHLKDLRLERRIDNPRGRARPQELVSDRQGRYSERGRSTVRSAMEPKSDPHEVEEERFAHELAELLRAGLNARAYDGLALIAPPDFLGVLKNVVPAQVQQRVVSSVAKDLTKVGVRDLPSHLDGISMPSIMPTG